MNDQPNNDIILFRQIAKGNEDAFRSFFFLYNTRVYYFILHIIEERLVAEELTQDIFLKLWMQRGKLDAIDSPGNYLFVMAKHHALDHLERVAREQKLKKELNYISKEADRSTEAQIFYLEGRALLQKAVMGLPRQQRLVYRLSREEGWTREQIATHLKISSHTVKNHLAAAMKYIQQYLISYGHLVVLILCLSIV